MITRVPRETDEPGSSGTRPSGRKGEWSALGTTVLTAFWIYATLTYLWDTADHARLAQLILFSVAFGFGIGQLPPVRSLLGRRRPGGTHEGPD